MGCERLPTLWASGAPTMFLWSRGEKEVEVLRRLPTTRGRITNRHRSSSRATPLGKLPVPYGSCQTRYPAATVPTSTAP